MGTVSYSTPSSWDPKQSTQLCQDLLMDWPLFWILNRWRKYFQFVIQTLYLYSTPLNHRWKIICRMVWLKLRGQGFPTKCHIHTIEDFLRVTVHSTRTLPLVDEQGLDVETNQATNIAFHSINYERQKHPYGTCISSWNETELGSMVTSEHGELPYTQGVDLYSLST